MLKKTLSFLGYLVLIACLGLVFRYVALNSAESTKANASSSPLFAASLVDIQGKTQDLSQYQGKIIVLNFWATWCPPCREEMPELSQLHQAYQSKNVAVLGVAIDELDLVKEFLQASPVTYPILVNETSGMDLSDQLGNNQGVLPYTVIIDSNGNVVKTYFGRISKSLLETTIDTLLPH